MIMGRTKKDNIMSEETPEISLEESFGLLEEKLETLESGEISLEESFQIYKEGMDLLKQCHDKIDRVEKKVLEINEAGELVEF